MGAFVLNLRICICFLIGIAFCSGVKAKDLKEDDVSVAMFRFVISGKHIYQGSNGNIPPDNGGPVGFTPTLYFLSYKGKDASPSVMNRLRQDGHRIKGVSQSVFDKNLPNAGEYSFRDKKTKKVGIIYQISTIKWISRFRVQIRAGYSGGLLNGESALYTLELKQGHWVVVSEVDLIAS